MTTWAGVVREAPAGERTGSGGLRLWPFFCPPRIRGLRRRVDLVSQFPEVRGHPAERCCVESGLLFFFPTGLLVHVGIGRFFARCTLLGEESGEPVLDPTQDPYETLMRLRRRDPNTLPDLSQMACTARLSLLGNVT